MEKMKKSRKQTIAGKTRRAVLLILIPSLILLVLVSAWMASNEIESLSDQILQSQTSDAVNRVDAFFKNKITAASMFKQNAVMQSLLKEATTPEKLASSSELKNATVRILGSCLDSMKEDGVEECWVVGIENDTYLLSSGEMGKADLQTLDWDEKIHASNQAVVSEPFFDDITERTVISIVSPVYDGTTIIGYAGFDVFRDTLAESLSTITVGEEGFMELISNEFEYIYSMGSTLNGKKISEIEVSDEYKNKVQQMYTGPLNYSYDGESYTALFNTCETTGWLITSNIPTNEIYETRDNLVVVMFCLSVAILIILIILLAVIIKRITAPLSKLTTGVEQFAKGDLSVDIQVTSNDEIGVLAGSVRRTIQNLKGIIENISQTLAQISQGNLDLEVEGEYVGDFLPIRNALEHIMASLNNTLGQINQSSYQVSSGADQVSSGAQALSQGATEQASSVQELAATVNEISSQVQMNAVSAKSANEKASAVGREMTESNEQMQHMIQAMNDINVSSAEIGKIIKTIEDIAFQTNILALNAAVEAARAGQAGKGFAVVADEVRNLSSKSSEASKDTVRLIENSMQSVENGTRIAGETQAALLSAVKGAQEVAGIVNTISTACDEQADSIKQVTVGLDQISAVVQTNSATAEESAAASEELSGQAQILKSLVGQFTIKKMDGDPTNDIFKDDKIDLDQHAFSDNYSSKY